MDSSPFGGAPAAATSVLTTPDAIVTDPVEGAGVISTDTESLLIVTLPVVPALALSRVGASEAVAIEPAVAGMPVSTVATSLDMATLPTAGGTPVSSRATDCSVRLIDPTNGPLILSGLSTKTSGAVDATLSEPESVADLPFSATASDDIWIDPEEGSMADIKTFGASLEKFSGVAGGPNSDPTTLNVADGTVILGPGWPICGLRPVITRLPVSGFKNFDGFGASEENAKDPGSMDGFVPETTTVGA
jgi:hypothetical protein